MAKVKIVFGAASVGTGRALGDPATIPQLFTILQQEGCTTIDTATYYGNSEEKLGKAGAGQRFTIDTKATSGLIPGSGTREGVIKNAENSRNLLGIDQVDVWYLHAPDMANGTPLEDTLEGVNEMYKAGFFKRFGLSNFFAEDVQRCYDICKDKGYPLPKVYQGNYNAVGRKQEEALFPTLRKLNMSFYAYSPIAGGFLTKSAQDIAQGKGRFNTSSPVGKLYVGLYNKPTLLEALAEWEDIAKEEGIPRAELAYRWTAFNSHLDGEQGDALLVGASSLEQVKETLTGLRKGPLSEKAAKRIDEIWEKVKHEAGLDPLNG